MNPKSYQDNKAFPEDKDKIFRACAEAISQCRFRILETDPTSGQIWVRTGRWAGEDITVKVDNDGMVHINSVSIAFSRVYPQVTDYGNNRANVDALFSVVGQLLSRSS
jgi:hypothetical protein